jgi:hypothetical protein
MAKTNPASSDAVVRDVKSGRLVTVRGVGALKGHLKLKKGIDLTKPIASQTLKDRARSKGVGATAKR